MWLFQGRNRDSHVREEDMEIGFVGIALIVGLGLIWFWNSIYIIKEWERGVVLRLGRLLPQAKGAGINLVLWPIETLYRIDRKSTRLNSSHGYISYAVFCLKKKKIKLLCLVLEQI